MEAILFRSPTKCNQPDGELSANQAKTLRRAENSDRIQRYRFAAIL